MTIRPYIQTAIATLLALQALTGCSFSNEGNSAKQNERQVDIHATPVDPLAGKRSPPIVPITNVHEHMMGESEVKPLLAAMDTVGVERTVVLGSPMYTFILGMSGFTHYDDNNQMLLKVAKEHPDRIIPFVVLYAQDEDAPQKLRTYVEQGAKGVKLFSGHGASHGFGKFHTMPLDDPRLEAIYQVIEEHNLPVLFHVNYSRFADEFERVLTAHPTMRVLCPHFCLTLRDTRKVDSLLSKFPNLWMDVSFGWIQFQAEGYRRIDKKPELVRAVIEKYPDRFTFGSDLVLTNYEKKDAEWITMNMSFYRDLLERESYEYYGLSGGPLTGLSLSDDVLKRIYRDNAAAWLDGPSPSDITNDAVQKDAPPSE